jgi:ubiquinone/menaquinone biosynthesis C-methylase UbiE
VGDEPTPAPDPYARISRYYDRVIEPVNTPLWAIGSRMYSPPPGAKILDVGCGTGAHLALYAETDAVLYGVDSSPAMLDRARTRLGDRAELHVADASRLPFPNAMFDLVMASSMLHELDTPTADSVVGEVRRTLLPGGRFLVIDFRTGPLTAKGRLIRAVTHVVERSAGRRHYRSFRSFLRAGGLPALIAEHGFALSDERVVSGGTMHIALLEPR